MAKADEMRDTPYAREIRRAVHEFDEGTEARLERLEIKDTGAEEIRFSWWKDGRMTPRPLDLDEDSLLDLLDKAVACGVFSEKFIGELRDVLSRSTLN